MATAGPARSWNRFADRYAARAIKDPAAYDAMLADGAGRLRPTDRVLEIGCGAGSSPTPRTLSTAALRRDLRLPDAASGG